MLLCFEWFASLIIDFTFAKYFWIGIWCISWTISKTCFASFSCNTEHSFNFFVLSVLHHSLPLRWTLYVVLNRCHFSLVIIVSRSCHVFSFGSTQFRMYPHMYFALGFKASYGLKRSHLKSLNLFSQVRQRSGTTPNRLLFEFWVGSPIFIKLWRSVLNT